MGNKFLDILSSIIKPAVDYVEHEFESIGATLAAGFTVLLNAFTSDQRQILVIVAQFWQAHFSANLAAGKSMIDAMEEATTSALNEFAAEETAAFRPEIIAFLTLLQSAAKQNHA